MSSMFTNFLGKGFKKFANIFWKTGVTSLDMGKETTILNNIASSSKSSQDSIEDFGIGKSPNTNKTVSSKLIPIFWDDSEKVDKEKMEHEINSIRKSSGYSSRNFSNIISAFKARAQISAKKSEDDNTNSQTEKNEMLTNRLKNRVCEAYISANHPREDRSNAIQLKNFDGYFLSVLDGHGGEDVAEYANKELHKKFDQKYMEIKDICNMREQEKVKTSIAFAFEQVEKEYYTKAIEKYNQGDAKFAYIGSCALCVVVHDNLLYVANLGDCKAKLFRKQCNQNNEKHYIPIKITITHNASKFYEQKRLRDKFKDKDIIVEKGYASYVKGRLQPTKTLGDFYMKHKEFNNPPLNIQEKYLKRVIENFNGPYIDNIPDVQVFELTADDEFLVLATDGLWDWLGSKDVAEIINLHKNDKSKIADSLWKEALTRAAHKANLKIDQVLELPRSIKRTVHDDISLLVIDLKNQVSSYKSKREKVIRED